MFRSELDDLATVHRECFVLAGTFTFACETSSSLVIVCVVQLPPKPDRNEKKIPYFEGEEVVPPLHMLRFVALHQWFKLGWIAQQFVNCSLGFSDRLIRSESMFVLRYFAYRATSGFSVIAMNEDLIDTAATNQIHPEGGQLFSLDESMQEA